MSKKYGFKNYLQGAALLLFLVGLPLGSWYYLDKGLTYNKELMAELKDYGQMPDFKFMDENGNSLSKKQFAGKVVVVNFFNTSSNSYTKKVDYLQRFYKQFHAVKELAVVSFSLEPDRTNSDDLQAVAKKADLANDQNVYLTGDRAEMLRVLAKGFQVPDLKNRAEDRTIPRSNSLSSLPNEYPYFVLIDDKGMIRNYYDVNDEKAVINLVEHTAMIIPKKSEEKAVLKREKEK